jgi:xylan 1,4-beta-xylosidase
MKHKLIFCAATVAIFAACLFETQAATYNLTVLANKHTHAWSHFAEMGVATDHMNGAIHTVWGIGWGGDLPAIHNQGGVEYFRGHAILDADIGLVVAASATTLTLNWTRFDSVYDMGVNGGMRPELEISCTPPPLASGTQTVTVNYNGVTPNKSPPTKYGWGQWEALMDSIVTHCEARYGVDEVRKWYFEVWNEPDWWYIDFDPDYMPLYAYTVTGLKMGDSLIKVGGPAAEGGNTFGGGNDFALLLNYCHGSTNPATGKPLPLDFLSYHWYLAGSMSGTLNTNNDIVLYQKMILDQLRENYSWYTGIVICDEQGGLGSADLLQSGSWLVDAAHQLNEMSSPYTPPVMFDHWCLSDAYEEEMSGAGPPLAFGAGGNFYLRGDSTYENSLYISKPVIQAYNMLHRLSVIEDSSYGGAALGTADGVNLMATSDSANDSIQVLVYDNYNFTSPSSEPTDSIILTVNNIPWAPANPVHMEQFLVDTTHWNTQTEWVKVGKPSSPTHAQWDSIRTQTGMGIYDSSTQTLTGTTYTKAFSQHYWGVSVMVLSNPKASAIRNPADATKSMAPVALRADIRNGKLMLTVPAPGLYKVGLYTTSGRKVFGSGIYCAGTAAIPLRKIPAGVYILQCSGLKYSLVKQVGVRS